MWAPWYRKDFMLQAHHTVDVDKMIKKIGKFDFFLSRII